MSRWRGRTRDVVKVKLAEVGDSVVSIIMASFDSRHHDPAADEQRRVTVCEVQTVSTSTMPMSSSRHRK